MGYQWVLIVYQWRSDGIKLARYECEYKENDGTKL